MERIFPDSNSRCHVMEVFHSRFRVAFRVVGHGGSPYQRSTWLRIPG